MPARTLVAFWIAVGCLLLVTHTTHGAPFGFEDAGWEHLGHMGGWQYFRTLAGEGELPEIYSDPDSKIQKYHRILAYLTIFLPIMIIFLTRDNVPPYYPVIRLVYAVFFIVYAFAMVKLFVRIRELKHL